ncbi:MAG: hypothetical protein JXR34_11640 [Bacteroidales bacterium]|nr:hypothetical protein [Bacteroidales bacterium]
MKKQADNNLIRVGDVVLTQDALSIIGGLQVEGNYYLKDFRNYLGDAAFAILKLTRVAPIEEKQEYISVISNLELMHEELNLLQAPE